MADLTTLSSSADWRAQGNALLSEGRLEEARHAYEQAVACGPLDAAAHISLGYAQLQFGAAALAENVLRLAVQLDPTSADASYLLALALQAQGQHEEALHRLKKLLQEHPNFAHARRDLARALERNGQSDEALVEYELAWGHDKSQPDLAGGYLDLLLARRSWERVLTVLDEAQNKVPEAKLYRARALYALDRNKEALILLEEILGATPDHVFALNGKAAVLISMGEHHEALQISESAQAIAPGSYHAWANAGTALGHLGRHEEALAVYDKAALVDPDEPEAWINRVQGLIHLNRCVEAQQVAQDGLKKYPDNPELRWRLAIASLLQGDFATGWPAHESRWATSRPAEGLKPLICPQPLWTGQDLAGKSLLLYHEQGFGDTLQMLRFVSLVANKANKVLLSVPEPLQELARESLDTANIEVTGEVNISAASFDFQCPLMSLPLAFSANEQSIPKSVPYLRIPATAKHSWQSRTAGLHSPKVGLAWSGNPNHRNDANRSIPLESLLSKLPRGYAWVCLQKELRAHEKDLLASHPEIATYSANLLSFSDTAALVDSLDLVISVDTSVVHLAGALAKPIWVLLPFAPDWRWMLERQDSPWYPTARVFRQDARRDWAPVLDRVVAELQAWLPKFPIPT
jgi:tetratricopeptide (TPR) repeat protein